MEMGIITGILIYIAYIITRIYIYIKYKDDIWEDGGKNE